MTEEKYTELKAPFEIPTYWESLFDVVVEYVVTRFPGVPFQQDDLDLIGFFTCCCISDPESPILRRIIKLTEDEWNKMLPEIKDKLN